MHPHESISWALTAWHLKDNYLPIRTTSSGARAYGSSFMFGITEAAVLISVFELVRDIELSLKRQLAAHLKDCYGNAWWQALPPAVQKNGSARHRWAALQLGARRAGGTARMEWLCFGDVAKALRALSPGEWQKCLRAETKRRIAFGRAIARVKTFRDRELAHPKPTRMTNHQIHVLCCAVQALPNVLCPSQWSKLLALLAAVQKLPREHQARLADDLNFRLKENRPLLRKWLACPAVEPPHLCVHRALPRHEVLWREAVLSFCAELDAGRRVFFSYGEPLT